MEGVSRREIDSDSNSNAEDVAKGEVDNKGVDSCGIVHKGNKGICSGLLSIRI